MIATVAAERHVVNSKRLLHSPSPTFVPAPTHILKSPSRVQTTQSSKAIVKWTGAVRGGSPPHLGASPDVIANRHIVLSLRAGEPGWGHA
jgi:hypothetical protein